MYRIMPIGYKRSVKRLLELAGSKVSPKGFVNYTFSFSLALAFVIAFFIKIHFLFVWIVLFASFFFLSHGFLILAIDKRTRFVERILPDALQLTAANCRAGYIPSRALLMSARKEFGPLADAIKMVGKEILTGKPLEESLKGMCKYIKSDILDRTIKLIIEGIKGGGHFATLLEENANDIRNVQGIKGEIRSSILMYTIFISFAGCLGAPILYSLSTFLIGTIGNFGTMTAMPTVTTKLPFMKFGGIDISPDFLLMFSLTAILITSLFGGVIVGLIDKGKVGAGIKYIPIFVVIALVTFFLTGIVIDNIFGGIILG